MEFRFRRHDGEYRWLTSSAVPRFNADGSFIGYIGSATDITERKLVEESHSKVSQRWIETQEDERVKIARQLRHHIDSLIVLSINLDRYEQNRPESAADVHQEIGEIRQQITDIVSGILDSWHRLDTAKVEYLGLPGAAVSFCKELADERKVKIDFHSESVPAELGSEPRIRNL